MRTLKIIPPILSHLCDMFVSLIGTNESPLFMDYFIFYITY